MLTVIKQWFAMGGYAWYVWSVYGLALTLLLGNVLTLRWQARRFKKRLANRVVKKVNRDLVS